MFINKIPVNIKLQVFVTTSNQEKFVIMTNYDCPGGNDLVIP